MWRLCLSIRSMCLLCCHLCCQWHHMCSPSFYMHWVGCGEMGGLKTVSYLDEGVFAVYGEKGAKEASGCVQDILVKSGMLVNEEKSVWMPSPVVVWLGFTIDLQPLTTQTRVLSELSAALGCTGKVCRVPRALPTSLPAFSISAVTPQRVHVVTQPHAVPQSAWRIGLGSI